MESCAVPGADARIWRVVEVRPRENDRADAQNRPEYADRKWVQDLTYWAQCVYFLVVSQTSGKYPYFTDNSLSGTMMDTCMGSSHYYQ